MCGIVGAVSTRNIVPILVQGLQRLEYRGYDSCGVAVHAVVEDCDTDNGEHRQRDQGEKETEGEALLAVVVAAG